MWPYPYLDAWRVGEQLSPASEVAQGARSLHRRRPGASPAALCPGPLVAAPGPGADGVPFPSTGHWLRRDASTAAPGPRRGCTTARRHLLRTTIRTRWRPRCVAGARDRRGLVLARGEIWWADLPAPTGSGPGKRRPVLVVSADSFNLSRIGTVVAVAINSSLELAAAPATSSCRPAGRDRRRTRLSTSRRPSTSTSANSATGSERSTSRRSPRSKSNFGSPSSSPADSGADRAGRDPAPTRSGVVQVEPITADQGG